VRRTFAVHPWGHLDCPVGSRFIVCIAAENNSDDWGGYYANRASAIASDLRGESLPVESWRMASKTFIFIQGKIDQSSHYDVIKMRSLSKRQFCMKEELMFTNIPPKHNDVDDSVWITYIHEIRYDYYDD